MSEPVFEAFARIRPVLDPSFRQDAQAQIQQAVDAAQAAVKVTPRQALLGTAQSARELSLSGSVRETEALGVAFRKLEVEGVASQERIAAAAVDVRTALGLTGAVATSAATTQATAATTVGAAYSTLGAEGVAAQQQIQQAAQQTSREILSTGQAAQDAAQAQIAAAQSAQRVQVLPASQQQTLARSGLGGTLAAATATRVAAETGATADHLDALGAKFRQLSEAGQLSQETVAKAVAETNAQFSQQRAVATQAGTAVAESGKASITAFAGGAVRVGLYAFALQAAFRVQQHLTEALKVTGTEAFTTEGRLRNFGAALTSADIVGGIQALTAVPQHLQDIGISARDAGRNLDDFDRAAEGLGGSFNTIRDEAHLAAAAILEVDAAQRTALNSALALRGQNGQPIPFGNFGAQTPGGTPFVPTLGGTPTPDNSELQREIALQRAQRQGDLAAESKALQDQLKHAHYLVTITKGTGDLYRKRVAEEQRIKTALDSVHDQIVSNNEATKREAAAEKDRAKTAREQAARDATAAAATARTVIETNLQNEVAKAALTKRKTDDIRTTNALIEYLKTVRDNTSLEATERAQAKTKITAARKNLQSVLSGEDPAAGEDDQRRLKELQLSNAEARAALTTRKSDDRKAILASITYYRNLTTTLRKAGKDIDAETAESARIAAQGRLKALKTTTAASGGASTEDFFKAAVANFRQFGSNISANPNGILSPQDARGAFAAIALADPLVTAVDRGTSEQRKQTLLLGSIAGALGVGAKPPARSAKASTAAADEALRHSIFLHGV